MKAELWKYNLTSIAWTIVLDKFTTSSTYIKEEEHEKREDYRNVDRHHHRSHQQVRGWNRAPEGCHRNRSGQVPGGSEGQLREARSCYCQPPGPEFHLVQLWARCRYPARGCWLHRRWVRSVCEQGLSLQGVRPVPGIISRTGVGDHWSPALCF